MVLFEQPTMTTLWDWKAMLTNLVFFDGVLMRVLWNFKSSSSIE